MKKIPVRDDLQRNNSFFRRMALLHKVKEAYQCILHNTGDDFMLLRFGRVLGRNALENTAQFNKQFIYLLHLFLKSILILFNSLTTSAKDNATLAIPDMAALFFIHDDSSTIKLKSDLLSPESNVDQWTWLLEQWRDVLRTMPLLLTKAGAFSRVMRTTIGIGLIHLGKCAETMANTGQLSISAETMNEQLFSALQMGFYFGIAYAVVDCLQDEINALHQTPLDRLFPSDNEKHEPLTSNETIDKWLGVMEQLLSGEDFDRSSLPKSPFTTMLLESFDSLRTLARRNHTAHESFNELALLLRSQRADQKTMDAQYDNEQLYLGQLSSVHHLFLMKLFHLFRCRPQISFYLHMFDAPW